MKIKEIAQILEAKVVCGQDDINSEVRYGFASDLMSDVLTLDSDQLVLITGLANMQVVRTAEMADVNCIVFVRDKHVSDEMIDVARENDMVLLECKYSMFNTIGKLYDAGLKAVY